MLVQLEKQSVELSMLLLISKQDAKQTLHPISGWATFTGARGGMRKRGRVENSVTILLVTELLID